MNTNTQGGFGSGTPAEVEQERQKAVEATQPVQAAPANDIKDQKK